MTAEHQQSERSNRPTKRSRRINGLVMILVVFAIIFALNYRPTVAGIACTEDIIASKPDVIMLGTWWCPYCSQARRYFNDNEVHYCEYDIERTDKGKEMYEQLGGKGIPLLIFGDKYRYDGYNERMVEEALALLEREKQQHAR